MKPMTYRAVKDKMVICKDGVYFALSSHEQIKELRWLLYEYERDYLKGVDKT